MKFDVYHKKGSRVSCLPQTGFAAYGKGVQLMSGSPMIKQNSRVELGDTGGTLLTSRPSLNAALVSATELYCEAFVTILPKIYGG